MGWVRSGLLGSSAAARVDFKHTRLPLSMRTFLYQKLYALLLDSCTCNELYVINEDRTYVYDIA